MASAYDRILAKAVAGGSLEIVKQAVKRGGDVCGRDEHDVPLLTVAVSKGHIDVVEFLLDHGASIDAHDPLSWTPLMHAAYHGLTPIVRMLIARGADRDWEDTNQQTALTLAQWSGHRDVENELLGVVAMLPPATEPDPLPSETAYDEKTATRVIEKLQGSRPAPTPFRKRPPHPGGPR